MTRDEFVPAGYPKYGEQVVTIDGQLWHLTTITPRAGPETVYNFEVAGEHVYYVGSNGLLVHNFYLIRTTTGQGQRLAKVAAAFRTGLKTTVRTSPKIAKRLSKGNVAVIEYIDKGVRKTIVKISRGGIHAEQRAWATLVRRLGSEDAARKAATAVYTELSPCNDCASFLAKRLGSNTPVYFSAVYRTIEQNQFQIFNTFRHML